MHQYLEVMRDIRDNGDVITNERTGTGTISVFGRMMRFDLKNNRFPLLTTKKLHIRSIVHELLWFIKGSTNNNDLKAHGVSIWDDWALGEDLTTVRTLRNDERMRLLARKLGVPPGVATTMLDQADREERDKTGNGGGGLKLLAEHGIPESEEVVLVEAGSLGPIYGKQWRQWEAPNGRMIDQLGELMDQLKTKPASRRLIVSAWNPADLPDESVSAQENIKHGRMALAACHCMFQLRTRRLNITERLAIAAQRGIVHSDVEIKQANSLAELLDNSGVPVYGLSCMLTQRSADFFLGVPFNIASYALLTAMIAQCSNMVPDELVWSGGDVHLYSNHLEQVNTQLNRTTLESPKLWLNPEITKLEDFTFDDIQVRDYVSHPAIKAPVSV